MGFGGKFIFDSHSLQGVINKLFPNCVDTLKINQSSQNHGISFWEVGILLISVHEYSDEGSADSASNAESGVSDDTEWHQCHQLRIPAHDSATQLAIMMRKTHASDLCTIQ